MKNSITFLRRYWAPLLTLVVVVVVVLPIIPTGWITRVDTTPDVSSTIASVSVPKPKTNEPRPFMRGERVKLLYENYSFGIAAGATGVVTQDWHYKNCYPAYSIAFDYFKPEDQFDGFCIPAWQLRRE